MSKTHEIVKIVNPGDNHVVPLYPKQDFAVFLDGGKTKEPDIDYKSDFFYVKDKIFLPEKKMHKFVFKQKCDLSFWSNFSRVYLGEVLTTNVNNTIGTLLVHLESKNKETITVINPDKDLLKLSPDMIIEIVVFEKDPNVRFDSTIISGDSGIRYQLVNKQTINPYVPILLDDNQYSYIPRSTQIYKERYESETHFWFKINSAYLSNNLKGVLNGGKIIISSQKRDYSLQLQVNFKKKVFKPSLGGIIVGSQLTNSYQSTKTYPNYSYTPRAVQILPKGTLMKEDVFLEKTEHKELDGGCHNVFTGCYYD